MRSNNPILSKAPEFSRGGYATFDARSSAPAPAEPSLEEMYAAPSATPVQTGRMTYDDVVMRTGMVLGTVIVVGALSYFLANPLFMIVGLVGGFVLGLVNSFKREPSPALIMAYAAFEGLFLGTISRFIEASFGVTAGSLVLQAVLATAATFVAILALYRSGKLRATPKFTKTLIAAGLGYAVFCLINLMVVLFTDGGGFRSGPLGLLIGAVGAVIAALFLVLDFDFIERGVRNGLPERFAWTAAFGLVTTLVWLYIEFLRIFAILQSSD